MTEDEQLKQLMEHPIIQEALLEDSLEQAEHMQRYYANPLAFEEGKITNGYTLEEACQGCSVNSLSEVWFAKDEQGRQVVIKRPTILVKENIPQLAGYVQQEADVLGSMDHENIVKLLDVFYEIDPQSNLAIPHIVTPELACEAYAFVTDVPILKTRSTINEEYLFRLYVVMAQAAEGLTHLHSQGLIHGDFNPSQMMFDEDGTLKIIDLSSSRKIGERLTVNGEIVITPHYFPKDEVGAPYTPRPLVDPSQDLYAFGMSVLELLLPVTGMEEGEIQEALLDLPAEQLVEMVRSRNIVPEYLLSSIVGNCFDTPQRDTKFCSGRLKHTVETFAMTRYLSNRHQVTKDIVSGIKTVRRPMQDYKTKKPW